MNKARAESFSDGVFAFAITLLVPGVQTPELKTGSNEELRADLIRAMPQLVPYVTSFATIGIIWLNHHAMFHGVERVEHTTLTLNLLLLLVVAFIPYPTAVLSRYGDLAALLETLAVEQQWVRAEKGNSYRRANCHTAHYRFDSGPNAGERDRQGH